MYQNLQFLALNIKQDGLTCNTLKFNYDKPTKNKT